MDKIIDSEQLVEFHGIKSRLPDNWVISLNKKQQQL